MDGRQIPGFFFDPVKKKYFPIQSGGRAPPDYKYTHANVRKQIQLKEAEKNEVHRVKRRKTESIVTCHEKKFLSRAYFDRELGTRKSSYYLKHIWPGAIASQIHKQTIHKSPNVRYFDQDAEANIIYTVDGESEVRRHEPLFNSREVSAEHDDSYLALVPERLARMTSPVSSFHCLPNSGGLVVTTFGSDRPPVVYFTDPKLDGPYIGEQFTPRNCSTIWTSAPKPLFCGRTTADSNSIKAAQADEVAVGAASEIHLFSRDPAGPWEHEVALKTNSDILALTWLDPRTIALGHRDGKIRIYDTRSKGASQVLSHPAPISQLRPADDFTRIVCSGVCNTLMLYDMRKASSEPSNYHKKARNKVRMPFRSSSAYVTQFKYENEDIPDLGIDVNARLGLVAAAESSGSMKMWNMFTGDVIRKFQSDRRSSSGRVRCLRFYDEEDGGAGMWANVDPGISRFGW